MEPQPIEIPKQIADEAGRLAYQLQILEKLGPANDGWTDQSEEQNLNGVFKKIDAEVGKIKLSCLNICLTNSRNHNSGLMLHILDELTQLSGHFNKLIEHPSSIQETSTSEQNMLKSNQELFMTIKRCLMRISRILYDWRQ
jgi:hypothetical protein